MPINIFDNKSSSHDNGKKIDTSIFVQKPSLRTNYIESKIEEDIDTKNPYKVKNLPCLQEVSDSVCKSYVDSGLNDPNLKRKTSDIDFNFKKNREDKIC